MPDDQCDCVSVVEVACDWAAEPWDRPAAGSAIPQFMKTGWVHTCLLLLLRLSPGCRLPSSPEGHTRSPTHIGPTESGSIVRLTMRCLTLRMPSRVAAGTSSHVDDVPGVRRELECFLLDAVLVPFPITRTLVGSTVRHLCSRSSENPRENKNHKRIEPALPLNERKASDAA